MAPAALDQVGAAGEDACLRAAEELVAAERNEVGALGERAARVGLVGQDALFRTEQAAPDVEQQRDARRFRDGCEVGDADRRGEADDLVVGRMNLQDQRRPVVRRAPVVAFVRPVRRPDLFEHGPRGFHHVGEAELAADLDQLAAADDHLSAFA